jgi:hypothetical protein
MQKQIDVEVSIVQHPKTKRMSMVFRKNGRVVERAYLAKNSIQSKSDARDVLGDIAKDKNYRVYDPTMNDYNGGYWE